MQDLYQQILDAKEFIASLYPTKLQLGLILGSGLGELADKVNNPVIIPYSQIPHFPASSVEGHQGCLVLGELAGKTVGILKGRTHYYEGYSTRQTTFPVRVFKALGAGILIATNAAGGLNPDFKAGDLMLICDHINLIPDNPLRGLNDPRLGVRFPDVTDAYDRELINLTLACGAELRTNLRQGVYLGVDGPDYETFAELDYLRNIGGDAVGASTVPEILVARHEKMKCLGISCITNLIQRGHGISHEEVLETAQKIKAQFIALLTKIIGKIAIGAPAEEYNNIEA